MPKNDQPIALDQAHLGSRLHRSRGQSSVLESWRSLGSPQLPGPSFPAYESPPTANRRVHWWGFTTLQDGSRRILPPVRLGETEKMWVDKGKEFYNKAVKDLIELYSTENEEKSSVVERWIRTMKEKMWKYFSANSTNVYIDVLPDLVREYNNTRHSSIKMTPVKASKKEKTNLGFGEIFTPIISRYMI